MRADSHPTALRATAWLRSRLPGDNRFGDTLSTAGREGPQVLGRRISEVQPDRASASHELGMGLLQMWQGLSEASGHGHGDEQLTIVFADLRGRRVMATFPECEQALEAGRRLLRRGRERYGAHQAAADPDQVLVSGRVRGA